MRYTEAIELLKSKLPDYLNSKGINPAKPFNCLNPKHDDRNPSMSYDAKNQRCHCFSCGASYDLLDLIGIDYGLDLFYDQLHKAADLYGIEIEKSNSAPAGLQDPGEQKSKTAPEQLKDYSEQIRSCAMQLDDSPALDYLKRRGISPETAARHAIGYDPAFTSATGAIWPALIIPTGDMQHSVSVRNMEYETTGGNRYEKRGPAGLFNARAISEDSKNPLFIAEGELDALSIIEAGGEAVGLGSAQNMKLIEAAADQIRADRLVILALDNDEAGQKGSKQLYDILTGKGINCAVFNPYGSAKDANDALITNREDFRQNIRNAEAQIRHQRIAEYKASTSAAGMVAGFLQDVAESRYNRPVSTGFQQFDKLIDGGLYSGLYVLGAISSLGKTTFCLQIADQIAASGQDVMIFSLEMGAYELIAKSISRNSVILAMEETHGRRDYAVTTRGVMDGSRYDGYSEKQKRRIAEATRRYKDYAENLIIHAAIGKISVSDIEKAVTLHRNITGAYPVVIIDYLQILKPESDRQTDKQATDSNITALKQLARNMPVIAISSMNRESYKTGSKGAANGGKVSVTDLKESGGIDYGADVIIGLQFSDAGEIETDEKGKKISAYDERAAKKEDPRRITAVILKNRNGAVYGETDFKYIPMFNYFTEVKR